MKEHLRFIVESRVTAPDAAGGRQFCNVLLRGEVDEIIGDPDAWAVLELMESSISSMLRLLRLQEFDPTIAGSAEDIFLSLRHLREAVPSREASYFSIPRSVECFDGEAAYLIRQENGMSRFIWRDFRSGQVRERRMEVERYLADWEHALLVISSHKSTM